MTIFLSLSEAMDMIRHNKMRSFLTMLGMNIGVAAIIAVVALGLMAREEIMGEVDDIGSAILWVEPNWDIYSDWSDFQDLEMEHYQDLQQLLRNSEIVPYLNGQETVRWSGYSEEARITGVSGNYMDVFPYEIARGRFLDREDDQRHNKVVVLGERAALKWFGQADPLGEQLQIGNSFFQVIGVMAPRAQGFMSDGTGDNTIYIPINSYTDIWVAEDLGTPPLDLIIIQAPAVNQLDDLARKMENYFFSKHGLYGRDPYFQVNQAKDEIDQFNKIFGVITTVVSIIAGISLLVSGIGIMNIMLMAITERTKEIGIRKALGARREDILQQFLIEAIIICFLGGGIGVLLGLLLSWLVAATQSWNFAIPFFSVVGGLGVSIAVGLFFGIYPASRAAHLPPIQALGRE